MRVTITTRDIRVLQRKFRTGCHHARLELYADLGELELRCGDPGHDLIDDAEYRLELLPPYRGADLIREERDRQISDEGWTEGHDAEHEPAELLEAAIAYLMASDTITGPDAGDMWPWDPEWFKPGDRERNLVKAGALIAAEIDRARAARDRPDSVTVPMELGRIGVEIDNLADSDD